ncbi:MAG: biotin carboxylase [Ruminococcaceae bacterium]|nr:biotin carboxylase [Oscillospiraceae bacterium]
MAERELNSNEISIPKRVLNTLLTSLSSGVVPRIGAPYIAIGRQEEVNALLDSLDAVKDGGAAVRFLIGRYGSGKSFLIQLIRGYALDRGFLCADADLSPERRLAGGNNCGLATYRELMRNLSSKASPDGSALPVVLARHYSKLCAELAEKGTMPESAEFEVELKKKIYSLADTFESSVGGFDFSRVLSEYYIACICDDAEKKSACLRWMRGEYSTKTEAKSALGFSVGGIIDDGNWYDYIKLWALFASELGYSGLVVYIDECVNLFKIPNRISRESNYEKILSIFNDTLQGRAKYLGVIFGGTPQFLEDARRGLFSYEALRSRLCDSRFTSSGYVNMSAPVIRLRRFSNNEFLALIARLTKLKAKHDGTEELLTSEEMIEFLNSVLDKAGSNELATPREIIRDYLALLNILRENPNVTFKEVLKNAAFGEASAPNEEAFYTSDDDAGRKESTSGASAAPSRKISLDDIDI